MSDELMNRIAALEDQNRRLQGCNDAQAATIGAYQAYQARLVALFGSEPPEVLDDLAHQLRTGRDEDVLVPSFAGQARIAWRWFKEQLKR